jgi:pilus assembly protein CpaB
MKEKAILIISAIIGVIAYFLTYQYLSNETAKIYKGAVKITVIVAKRDLPSGTELTMKDLALSRVFQKAVGSSVFQEKDLNLVLNKKLLFAINRGDPLLWSYIETPRTERGGLAPMITSGLRALAISVSGDAAVDGHVKPNDRVDILGTFTFPSKTVPGEMESITLTVLQDVTVLATGKELAKQDTYGREVQGMRGASYGTVTLEVTPREAELLVFAQNVRGQLKLSLRNPSDMTYETVLPSVDFKHIETKIPEYNANRQRDIRQKKETP